MKIDDRTCVQYGRLPELRHPCKQPELRRPAHLRQWRHGLSTQFSSKINKLRYLMMASQGLQMMVELRLPSMTAALQGQESWQIGASGVCIFQAFVRGKLRLYMEDGRGPRSLNEGIVSPCQFCRWLRVVTRWRCRLRRQRITWTLRPLSPGWTLGQSVILESCHTINDANDGPDIYGVLL